LATGVDALVLNWLIDTTQARLAEERLCNNEDERECLDSCVMLGKCEDERYDFNAQMDCKQECQVKCCRHQVKKDSLFSKRPIRVKQDAGINASEYIVPLSSEPMENMCSTAEERACREMCFDDKKCDDDDEDCKKVRLNSMGKGLTIFCGFGLRLMFLALVSSLDELLFRQI
jgi:hypothetical protein